MSSGVGKAVKDELPRLRVQVPRVAYLCHCFYLSSSLYLPSVYTVP